MLSKTKRPYDPDGLPPARRLRHNIVDLFGRNTLGGSRASNLLRDAAVAGAPGCAELVAASASSDAPHGARTLTRRLLKWTIWPDVYWAEVRVWDTRRSCVAKDTIAMLLPHELAVALARTSQLDALMSKSRLDENTKRHLLKCEEACGENLLGFGLWGDGVPCNWDRSDSLNLFSLNIPGLPPPWHTLRIPLTGFSKKHFAGKETYDDLLAILAWSFEQLAIGHWPKVRHDGAAWKPSDSKRRRQAGVALPCRGALVEIRGDWAFMRECFGLPAWNEAQGLCWLCSCTPNTLRQVGADAPWRSERLSHQEVLGRMLRRGITLSPVFSVPWLTNLVFRPDWLHCADQGVAADFLGNLFFYLVARKLEGPNKKRRCEELWRLVQDFYRRKGVVDKLQNLVPGMLAKAGQPPKLRCSAAQCRALVPLGSELGERFLRAGDPFEGAMLAASRELRTCYDSLSAGAVERADMLSVHSRRFAAQCIALEAAMRAEGNDVAWRIKPKLHLFLELCSDGSQPSLFWTYRDEDFGGACAHLARRRGGLLRAGATSRSLLTRFCILQGPPRIV